MSTSSSSEVMQQEEEEGNFPNWVDSFLGKIFFERCVCHNMQKNELNRYCINCDAPICRFCIITGNHFNHSVLTIYRHVYQNVVPLSEMENHIECGKIQPYKCNKKWVVSLTPLPHNGSGSLIEGDGACYLCKRKLTDPDRYRFCSIACKVQSDVGNGMVDFYMRKGEVEQKPNRKRGRKGVPHRAPF
ncbi:hypothetical protein AAHA92_01952 [Salvia divinorum]|uniref:B box-type domain-containing protein n=1 Tax=Salvia divinorum TaxID=28513 RepID=A0ABD1ID32_SALDI